MDTTDLIIRLLVSAFVGGAIGFERELRSKSAGFVTITLVCLGATIVALIQEEMLTREIKLIAENNLMTPVLTFDMTRLSAQVISGVGFIGGGSIIYAKDKVHGITTAAILWISACIGLAIGYGFINLTIMSLLLVLIIMVLMKSFEKKVIYKLKKKILKRKIEKKE